MQKSIPDKGKQKRLVLVGGGFAGLEFVKMINDRHYQVVFLDKNNYYQFQPLLYQVATGGLVPSSVSFPLRKMLVYKNNTYFRMCEVQAIDPDKKVISTNKGDLDYDYLVLAHGCETNFFGNEEIKKHSLELKSVSQAILMRNQILSKLENVLMMPEEKREAVLNFVVVGGGPTGVELAGALFELKKAFLPRDYKELPIDNIEVHLLEASPRLLGTMSEKASKVARGTLESLGVHVHTGEIVESYDGTTVKTKSGFTLKTHNLFWVAGVKPVIFPGLSEKAYTRGRLKVNELHELTVHEGIFAIGDIAYMETEEWPKGHPQMAPIAMQAGRYLAGNLNNRALDRPERPFRYSSRGYMATIGKRTAAVDFGRWTMGGFIAWLMWLVVHLLSLVGVRNRLSVLTDWTWRYFTYDTSLQMLIRVDEEDPKE